MPSDGMNTVKSSTEQIYTPRNLLILIYFVLPLRLGMARFKKQYPQIQFQDSS